MQIYKVSFQNNAKRLPKNSIAKMVFYLPPSLRSKLSIFMKNKLLITDLV